PDGRTVALTAAASAAGHGAEAAPSARATAATRPIALCSLGKTRAHFGHDLLVLSLLLRRQGSFVIRTLLIGGSAAFAARLPRRNRQAGERSTGSHLGFFVGFAGRCVRPGGLGYHIVGRGDHRVVRRPKTES